MVYGEKTRGGNSTTHFESLVPQASVPMPDTRLPTITNNSARPDRITKWNTTNLGLRLGVDGGSAAVASALVAPLICVIDRYVPHQTNVIRIYQRIFLNLAQFCKIK